MLTFSEGVLVASKKQTNKQKKTPHQFSTYIYWIILSVKESTPFSLLFSYLVLPVFQFCSVTAFSFFFFSFFAALHHTFNILPSSWKRYQKVKSEIRRCSPAEIDLFQMKMLLILHDFQNNPIIFLYFSCRLHCSALQVWNILILRCPV